MDIFGFFAFIKKLISHIPFNIFDYVMFAGLMLYMFEDASYGLIPAGIGLIATVLGFFIGLTYYHALAQVLIDKLSLTKGIADAIAFLIVALLGFGLVSSALTFLRKKYLNITIPKRIDFVGGAILGFLSFFFIASFAISLLLSFPTSPVIKNSIKDSVTGNFFSGSTQAFEGYIRQVFGGAIDDTINFLTIHPSSEESVSLHFRTNSGKVDSAAERQMLTSVNAERRRVGLHEVVSDEALTEVAQDHARDMLERGYFSHYTPEGLSPFDRMARAEISYEYAGESLAFAPDVKIAMDGLMKSPGHRANILSPNFRRLGVGVIDAGIYGKMFVQEFTD